MKLHIAANNPRSVEDENGSHVAMLASPNAALDFMMAINAHDQLVAALRFVANMTTDRRTSADSALHERAIAALAAAGAK